MCRDTSLREQVGHVAKLLLLRTPRCLDTLAMMRYDGPLGNFLPHCQFERRAHVAIHVLIAQSLEWAG